MTIILGVDIIIMCKNDGKTFEKSKIFDVPFKEEQYEINWYRS